MKTKTIAEAKSNLSQLIHQLDTEDTIHLTRHGKPVAVILSEANYQKLINKNNSVFQAIMEWRDQMDGDYGFTDTELKQLRAADSGRAFSWDD
jgi:prevent-host-death family protein